MRFYVVNQSQLVIAGLVGAGALLAVIWLLIIAWKVLGESLQHSTLADSELVCRYCNSKAIHESFRAGFMDHLFAIFSCVPYRCGVCSWRFYLHRPHTHGRTASQVQ